MHDVNSPFSLLSVTYLLATQCDNNRIPLILIYLLIRNGSIFEKRILECLRLGQEGLLTAIFFLFLLFFFSSELFTNGSFYLGIGGGYLDYDLYEACIESISPTLVHGPVMRGLVICLAEL